MALITAVAFASTMVFCGEASSPRHLKEMRTCDSDLGYSVAQGGKLVFNCYGDIPNREFQNREGIISVTFPDTITGIGHYAFCGCKSLTTVIIGNSTSFIGVNAFAQCSSLQSVIISDSVTNLLDGAFMDCSQLTTVTIGKNVTSICQNLFARCYSLDSIIIPDSVASIGSSAFDESGLKSITIGNNVSYIGSCSFSKCGLTSITFPDSVTKIEGGAFTGCESLASVTFGKSVSYIGNGAFMCCDLKSITIPGSVTFIDTDAFCDCRSLESVTFEDYVTSLDASAFTNCYSLATVYFFGVYNPDTYNVFQLPRYTKAYVLWDYNSNITDESKDMFYNLIATRTLYRITYDLDNGILENANPAIGNGITNLTLNNPTKEGYQFIGWTGSNGETLETELTIPEGSEGDKSYKANWAIIYHITYYLQDGILTSPNPTEYHYKKENFTLNKPTKEGYRFAGWAGSYVYPPQIELTIPKGSTGEKMYLANWAKIYHITYDLQDGNLSTINPTEYDIETENITLNKPEKEGYRFIGWTGSNGETPQTEVNIPKGSTGNKSYTATWTVLYDITYDLDEGVESSPNPTQYDIERENITLSKPTKEGYRFIGWTGSNGDTPQTEVTIVKGSTGDKNYTANWAVLFYITYDLNGGILASPNPFKYDEQTENITLNNPIKEAYVFDGWTGSNGNSPQTEVTIVKGTKTDLNFTANWKSASTIYSGTCGKNVTYRIESGGTLVISGTGNMSDFETSPFVSYSDQIYSVIIEEGVTSIGNYAFSGCINIASITFQSSQKRKESEKYRKTALETSINGLCFIGKCVFLNCNELKEVKIPDSVSSIGDSAFQNCSTLTKITIGKSISSIGDSAFQDCAVLSEVNYGGTSGQSFADNVFSGCNKLEKINVVSNFQDGGDSAICGFIIDKTLFTIEYQGLEGADFIENPSIYSKNEETLISNPTKLGYTFNGWSGNGIQGESKKLIIPTGSSEDKIYTANWSPTIYRITYNLNGGTVASANPTEYSIESDFIKLNNPTKEGYKFTGWSGTGLQNQEETASISQGSTGDRNYVANWEEETVTENSSEGLSGGAIAAIVIGCLLVIENVALGIIFFIKYQNSNEEQEDQKSEDQAETAKAETI